LTADGYGLVVAEAEDWLKGRKRMKLATLKNGARDGKLVVVSRDLTRCTDASFLAPTLQAALDDWRRIAPHLATLAESLETGAVPSSRFHEHDAHSPLPRAYQWADGSAYLNHVELVRKSRGSKLPPNFATDPLMYQGGSDSFLAPRDPISVADEDWGIDMEGEVAVIVDDVPVGASADEAREAIRLVMLVNDVSLRRLAAPELAKGFGFFQSKPSSAFSPVAVTPDELGEDWDGARLGLPLHVDLNGKPLGRANAGEMNFDFGQLIAHAATTRPLVAGTILGSGTVSNKLGGEYGKPVLAGGAGYSCLAELRIVEAMEGGDAKTPFLHFGDTVRIEMKDRSGHSIFGAIEQTVEKYER
jgi:fumarylacetoacetate (FAA) hydrolase